MFGTPIFTGHDICGSEYVVTLCERNKRRDSPDAAWEFYLYDERSSARRARADTLRRGNTLKIDWLQTENTSGLGVGSILLHAILRESKERGVTSVHGWTSIIQSTPEKLVRLHDFYERFGAVFTYDDIGGHFFIH